MSDVIQHHGVLGMKWGRRKSTANGRGLFKRKKAVETTTTSTKKDTRVNDLERDQKYYREYQHRDRMSNREIKARISRMRLEREFKDEAEKPFIERANAEQRAKAKKAATRRKNAAMAIQILSQIPYEDLVTVSPENHGGDKAKAEQAQTEIRKNIKVFRSAISKAGEAMSKIDVSASSGNPNIVIQNGISDDVLLHYGVLGMRWKARVGSSKERRSYKLSRKAYAIAKKRYTYSKYDGSDKKTVRLNKKQMKIDKARMKLAKKELRGKKRELLEKLKASNAKNMSDVTNTNTRTVTSTIKLATKKQ